MQYGDNYSSYVTAWKNDTAFWTMLSDAELGDTLSAPTTGLGNGFFYENGETFGFMNVSGEDNLFEYQGYGPYALNGKNDYPEKISVHPSDEKWGSVLTTFDQPLYSYTADGPVYDGWRRQVSYNRDNWSINIFAGDDTPTVLDATEFIPGVGPFLSKIVNGVSILTTINNAFQNNYSLKIEILDKKEYLFPAGPIWTVPGGFRDDCVRPYRGDGSEWIK